MRALTLIPLLVLFSLPAFAKDSLIDMQNARSGGYGGPLVKYGEVGSETAIMLGGEGAGTFTTGNHSLLIGGAGYGLINEPEWAPDTALDFGYGGLLLGYTHRPDAVVHVETKMLLGAGAVSLDDGATEEKGSFLVSEVSIGAEINLTDFLEVGIGGAYRLTTDPSVDGITDDDLSGPSVVLSFQFGQI
ncbi:hypothetical protein [Saccharospirillum mangrovi]|uniref:hypothetical protein n=1 Tax=Saccharospirillum mangrovi TaxID=2161747 RepID=UPI000D3B46D6|nr:hypothetical protein [Saccharospirillum mangrovi]